MHFGVPLFLETPVWDWFLRGPPFAKGTTPHFPLYQAASLPFSGWLWSAMVNSHPFRCCWRISPQLPSVTPWDFPSRNTLASPSRSLMPLKTAWHGRTVSWRKGRRLQFFGRGRSFLWWLRNRDSWVFLAVIIRYTDVYSNSIDSMDNLDNHHFQQCIVLWILLRACRVPK